MSMLEKIYDSSPAWFQNIMCSTQGLLICRRRYNKDFKKELARFENNYYNQAKELVRFLEEVHTLKPYREYWDEKLFEECRKDNNKIYDFLKRFPIIDKNRVKENISDFYNESYELPKFEMRTSGTTGGALIFPYAVDTENKQWAVWWRYRKNLGIDLSTWCAWFGGKKIISYENEKPPYWRINYFGRQIMFSTWHLTEKTVSLYHKKIVDSKVPWIHGYPSHIARFADLWEKAGLPPIDTVKIVTTAAENVFPNQIKIISKAFPNAIIRQHYGLNEGVANMSQTKEGDWVVDDDFAYVEFIPVSKENPNVCKIVGTGFFTGALPLIRYYTGDIATITHKEDGSVKVISIDGRENNEIKQPSGRSLNQAVLGILLHDFMNIVEAQFHQKTLTDVDVFIVKGAAFNESDEKMFLESLKNWFENTMNFTIKYVDKVPRTKSGKLRTIVSDIQ